MFPSRKKRCPECSERVQAAAQVCRFCGYRFEQAHTEGEPLLRAELQSSKEPASPTVEIEGPDTEADSTSVAQGRGVAQPPLAPNGASLSEARAATDALERPLPLRTRARWVSWILVATIVVYIAGIAVHFDYLQLLNRISQGESVSLDEANAGDTRVLVAWLIAFGSSLLTTIAFIAWFYRAYRNLPRLGARNLRYRFGWAIGSWFIPIVALFMPKQIADDIWRGSDPDLPISETRAWRDRPVSSLLHWWWAILIIGGFAGWTAGSISSGAQSVAQEQTATWLGIGASILSVAASILAIFVVRAITTRQETRATRLAAMPTTELLRALTETDVYECRRSPEPISTVADGALEDAYQAYTRGTSVSTLAVRYGVDADWLSEQLRGFTEDRAASPETERTAH